MLSSQFFLKDVKLDFFIVKLYFYRLSRLFLDSSSRLGYIGSTPTFLHVFEV